MQADAQQPYTPELRKDIITREWAIIARGRSRRPTEVRPEPPPPPSQPGPCPFCPGNEGASETLLTIPDGPTGWRVRVVRNKYPALIAGAQAQHTERGIYDAVSGTGSHEVVIESPEHWPDLWQMPVSQVAAVLDAYRQRFLQLREDPQLRYVLVFRNHGPGAGASVLHPHSQLIATPVVPHYIEAELDGIKHYWEYIERCPYCAIVEQEQQSRERMVIENERFIAVAAFAGRYPFETWIIPRRHESQFFNISPEERDDFAAVLRELLGRLAGALNYPSYNYAIHTDVLQSAEQSSFHWHLEIFPRITTPGGFELGSDLYINTTPPEDAATALREATIPAGPEGAGDGLVNR